MRSSNSRSLKVPGSDSSPLHTMYFSPVSLYARHTSSHLPYAGAPAPPMPSRFAVFSSYISGWYRETNVSRSFGPMSAGGFGMGRPSALR